MAAALRICVMEEGRQAILPMWNLWRQECCRHLVAQTSRGAPFPRALSTGDTRERQGRFEGDPFKERKGLLETSEELFEPRPELKPLGWDWHIFHFLAALVPGAVILLWGELDKPKLKERKQLMYLKKEEEEARQTQEIIKEAAMKATEPLQARIDELEKQVQQMAERQAEAAKRPQHAGSSLKAGWRWLSAPSSQGHPTDTGESERQPSESQAGGEAEGVQGRDPESRDQEGHEEAEAKRPWWWRILGLEGMIAGDADGALKRPDRSEQTNGTKDP